MYIKTTNTESEPSAVISVNTFGHQGLLGFELASHQRLSSLPYVIN